MITRLLTLVMMLVLPMAVQAAEKLNAGPYWATKYETTYAGAKSFSTTDQRVTVTMDNISTINCSGCDTVYYYPGNLFHARNNSKAPVCFSFNYKLDAGDFNGVTSWGNGQVFLLKPHQTIAKFAGLTMSFSRSQADLSWKGTIYAWDPVDKKSCGANPYL